MPKYFCGDFNAGATNTFGGLLEDFPGALLLCSTPRFARSNLAKLHKN